MNRQSSFRGINSLIESRPERRGIERELLNELFRLTENIKQSYPDRFDRFSPSGDGTLILRNDVIELYRSFAEKRSKESLIRLTKQNKIIYFSQFEKLVSKYRKEYPKIPIKPGSLRLYLFD